MKCDTCEYKKYTTLGDMYGAMSGGQTILICDKTGEPLEFIIEVCCYDVEKCDSYIGNN